MTTPTVLPHVVPLSGGPLADDGGGGTVQWPAWLGPGVIITVVVIVLMLLLVSALVIRRTLRRLRSSGTLERGLLTARARVLPPGPAREIAALRLRLRDEVQGTLQMVSQSAATDPASVQLLPVLAGLQRTAAAMDADLASLESEPMAVRQRERLASYQHGTQQLIDDAARIRDAIATTAATYRETEMRAIAADVDDQVSYLDLYRQTYRRLNQPSELDLDQSRTTTNKGDGEQHV